MKTLSNFVISIIIYLVFLFGSISLFLSCSSKTDSVTHFLHYSADSSVTLVSPHDSAQFPDTVNSVKLIWNNSKVKPPYYIIVVTNINDNASGNPETQFVTVKTFENPHDTAVVIILQHGKTTWFVQSFWGDPHTINLRPSVPSSDARCFFSLDY